mgnify:CR=1 FL=1
MRGWRALLAGALALMAAAPAAAQFRGDFEDPSALAALRGGNAELTPHAARTGNAGLAVRGNAAMSLGPLLRHGTLLGFTLRARAESRPARLSIVVRGEQATSGQRLATMDLGTGWAEEHAGLLFVQRPGAGLPVLEFLVEPAGAMAFIDDVEIMPKGDWRAIARERLRARHTREVEITLVHRGEPVTQADVAITTTRRAFPLGGLLSARGLEEPRFRELFPRLFNFAVAENEMKWPSIERQHNLEDYRRADDLVAFAREHRLPLRGHTIFWEDPSKQPAWLADYKGDDLRREADERLRSLVTRYRHDVVHWDVVNEPLHHRYLADALGEKFLVHAFQRAHEIAPSALLFVNDYGILTSDDEIDAYIALVQRLRDAGAPIHALGVQGHFTRVDGPAVLARLDRLHEGLGLPIWITEFEVVEPDATIRARAVEDFYLAAASHPAVDGILSWGFWAGAHGEGDDAAWFEKDWTVNPAGEAYLRFLEDWTTREQLAPDEQGRVRLRAFHGEHALAVTLPDGRVLRRSFVVEDADAPVRLEIVLLDEP